MSFILFYFSNVSFISPTAYLIIDLDKRWNRGHASWQPLHRLKYCTQTLFDILSKSIRPSIPRTWHKIRKLPLIKPNRFWHVKTRHWCVICTKYLVDVKTICIVTQYPNETQLIAGFTSAASTAVTGSTATAWAWRRRWARLWRSMSARTAAAPRKRRSSTACAGSPTTTRS